MRKNWKKYQLKDVIENLYDGPHATPSPSNEGPIFLGIKNLTDDGKFNFNEIRHIAKKDFPKWTRRVLPSKNDIVFTYEATLHRYGLISDNMVCCLGRRMGLLRLNMKKADPNFLLLYFQSPEWKQVIERNIIVGATVNRIPISEMPEFPLYLPDISEQKKIASILSSLDKKIAINNRINAELESMAKLIYDYWFVQFDFPANLQDPALSGAEGYKSSGGKMVYNKELKREIPEGWEVATLLDIATFTNGLACQKYRPESDAFLPVIKIKEMRDGFTDKTEKVKTDVPDRIKIFDGDVLFSWSASLEVMIWSGGTGALNQHIFKVTSEKYPRSYYYFELLNYLSHFKMIAELRKTTMGHITQDHLKQSRIVIPPIEIVKSLDKKIKPILEKKINNHKQNQQLSKIRDWLLPMLMNGQVRVKEDIKLK